MIAGGGLAERTIAVVLAGGKGTRLGPLTRRVCKPALPFGAAYRNIDFTLSNCVNSGIRRIGVVTEHLPEALNRHLEAVWSRAARRRGEFIAPWPASEVAPGGTYLGTADAVYRNLGRIGRERPRLVLILAGDHVYRMDYRAMLRHHLASRAQVTVGAVTVDESEAGHFGILSTDDSGRIVRFVEKPRSRALLPASRPLLASMGIYVFDAAFLARVLGLDADSSGSRHDFGADVLPRLLSGSRVQAFRFESGGNRRTAYWRDVGTPAAYWRAQLELLDGASTLRLDDAGWPMPAAGGRPELTARHAPPDAATGRRESLIASGCDIAGVVQHSVVFAGAAIARGAFVADSVVLPGAVVGPDCRISTSIVDADCRIPGGTVIGASSREGMPTCEVEPVLVTAQDYPAVSILECA